MHRFDRGEPPVDLTGLERKGLRWDREFLSSAEHAILSRELYERQDRYCAYCETRLAECGDGHLDHLERRADNPQRTFDWSNLFFSCRHPDSCGRFKDGTRPRMSFDPEDIVDPSREDPLEFFQYDLAGGILPRKGGDERRARETIRIFNLDKSPRLRNLRRMAAETVLPYLADDCTEEDITALLESLGKCDCPSVYHDLLGRFPPRTTPAR